MNEAEYTEALNDLFRAIGQLDDPELLQSVVLSTTDGRSGRIRMLRALHAMQQEFDARSARVERVLARVNEVVRTEPGEEIDGISIVLDENAKDPLAWSVDVTAESRQLAELADLLTDLMNDVDVDDDPR